MNVKKTVIAVGMVMSFAALAGPPQAQPPPPGQGWGGRGPMQGDPAERLQHQEQRHRMMQVVGLTEVLGLSTQEALRMDEVLRRFDERRRPLREQVRESGKVVRDAAHGDAAAAGQVDQAIGRVLDARIQLATLDKEMFQALAKGLSPQQRARLALFYARLHKMKGGQMGGPMMMPGGGGHGPGHDESEGRRFRPWRMRRGQVGPPAEPGALAGAEPFGDD